MDVFYSTTGEWSGCGEEHLEVRLQCSSGATSEQKRHTTNLAEYHPTAIHYKINSPNPKTGKNYRNKFPKNLQQEYKYYKE
eukprot:758282-Amphidinium_carterae.1